MAQKVEIITWDEVKDDFGIKDPNDNNDGLIWGINYLDDEGIEIEESQWFATMEERNDATEGYDIVNYMG